MKFADLPSDKQKSLPNVNSFSPKRTQCVCVGVVACRQKRGLLYRNRQEETIRNGREKNGIYQNKNKAFRWIISAKP